MLERIHTARQLRRAGRCAEAVAELKAALRHLPRAWPLWHELGLALSADGRPHDAVDAYRRAIELGGARLAAAWVNLGSALRSSARKREAVDAYLTAIEIEPELSAAYYNLHAALYDDRAPRPAEAALERALALRPDHADARFYLGALRQLHHRRGEPLLAELPPACDFLIDSLRFVEQERERGAPTRLFADTFETLAFALERAPASGLVIELGVRHGTTLRFLAARAPSRTSAPVHGFDSFEGLPTSWGEQPVGLYSTGGEPPAAIEGAHLHPGWFRDTLPPFLTAERAPLQLLHVDCDLYASSAEALALLAARVQVGTVMIFDDYLCNPGWRDEEHRAWIEAAEIHRWRHRYLAFSLFTKQAVVRIESVG